ncbi:MAG TPA: TonB-dependent receptor plug domain-containing protein [Chryseosolibacter sp.]|nr:TonB-dependent receptor plug domain-containing protein [Chryseosolibacter sp.]
MRLLVSSFFVALFLLKAEAQVTISGAISSIDDAILPSARITVLPDSINLLSDDDGLFKVKTTKGRKKLLVSYVGYSSYQREFDVTKDTIITVRLSPMLNELETVEIEGKADRQTELFNRNQTSTNILNKEDITSIPVLGGEADLIKTLQLLPGTIRGVEGSSDLFVRGGAADQNLVLLDGAPIYNTSHLFGFLSVFNPDMLETVEAINAGFPARFGGRLSSILNVNTVSSIPQQTQASGDIGLIASRLMIEQPIIQNKASFWIAGRRTYIDKVVAAVGDELPYFFYDLNAKLILHPNKNDNIELAYYGGDDVLDWFRDRNNDGDGFLTTFESGNNSQTIRWRRKYANNWQTDLALARSHYRYDIRNIFEDNSLSARSDIEDYSGKISFTRDSLSWMNGSFHGGFEYVRHAISPSVISTTGFFSEVISSSETSSKTADELTLHAEYNFTPTDGLNATAGLRISSGMVSNKTYYNPEPRFSLRYSLNDNQALKLSYARMIQYIHRISNSAVSTPTDIWYSVTDSIRPQSSNQVALAYQKSFPSQKLLMSVEGYYKTMRDLIGYEEGTNLFFNSDFASKLVQGRGVAYGLEVLVRKDAGKLAGWISYTLSWSWRQFDEVNAGEWFLSRYDRRHNGAIVMQYKLNKRWSASVVWEFISGSRFTPVIGQYFLVAPTLTGVDLIPLYADLNGVKLADTHRLDVGIRFKSKPGKKFQWHWFAGVYNLYNRAAPVGISINQNEIDGSLSYQQPGLFGLLPFISYGFTL